MRRFPTALIDPLGKIHLVQQLARAIVDREHVVLATGDQHVMIGVILQRVVVL